MKFLEVTDKNKNEPVMINIDNIITIRPLDKSVKILIGKGAWWEIIETEQGTYEDMKELIKECFSWD